MNKLKFTILVLFVAITSYAQKVDTLKLESKYTEVLFKSDYDTVYTSIQTDTNLLKRDTPENFLLSFYSIPNRTIYKRYRVDPPEFYTDEILKGNYNVCLDDFKLKIVSVIEFKVDSMYIAVVKAYRNNYISNYQLVKKGGLWYSDASEEGTNFSVFLPRFSPQFCRDVYVNHHTGVSFIDEVLDRHVKEGVLNYNQFLEDFSKLDLKSQKEEILKYTDENYFN